MRGHAASNAFALAHHFGTQSRDGATIRAVGAVPLRQIVGYEITEIREAALSLLAPRSSARATGLGGKIFLRSEMTVKAAMRETEPSFNVSA